MLHLGLTCKYVISLKNLPETNNLAYFDPQTVTKKNVIMTITLDRIAALMKSGGSAPFARKPLDRLTFGRPKQLTKCRLSIRGMNGHGILSEGEGSVQLASMY